METHVTFGQILPVMITLAVVGVLLILGAFLLWRRGRRQQARRAPPSGPGKRKAAPEPAAQRTPGLMTRIQDFFFYTEEEKAVMQAGKARQTAPPDAVFLLDSRIPLPGLHDSTDVERHLLRLREIAPASLDSVPDPARADAPAVAATPTPTGEQP